MNVIEGTNLTYAMSAYTDGFQTTKLTPIFF
jgi:hypothetical protein